MAQEKEKEEEEEEQRAVATAVSVVAVDGVDGVRRGWGEKGVCVWNSVAYLHNCRHDVRRHIRETKRIDIRHKTTRET